jgi:HEAT repeat protein
MSSLDESNLIAGLTDPDPNARKAAADQLGMLATDEACEALLNVLSHPLEDVRMCAAEALSHCNRDATISALSHLLRTDQSTGVRQCAARSLGMIGRVEGAEALLDGLADSDAKVCRATARALGKIGDARATPYLVKLLRHDDPVIRQVSAVALGDITDTSAVPALIDALSDQTWMVRQAAAQALGQIGDKSAVPALSNLRQDANRLVRMVAEESLKKLSLD